MERVKQFEDNFKKRYNRDVEVYVTRECFNGKINKAEVLIKYKGKEYKLEEYYDENQLTKHVFVEINGKTHKYKRYIDAEINVADAIGEYDGDHQ